MNSLKFATKAIWVSFGTLAQASIDVLMQIPLPTPWVGGTDANAFMGMTQREVYQQGLGSEALPMEFYFAPADLYLKHFYTGVSGKDFNDRNYTTVEAMWEDAFDLIQDVDGDAPNPYKKRRIGLGIGLGAGVGGMTAFFLTIFYIAASRKISRK